jgi:alpha-tubulin suppressor-like RCC1 family protein
MSSLGKILFLSLTLGLTQGCNIFSTQDSFEIKSKQEAAASEDSEAKGAKVEYQGWDNLAISVTDGDPIVNPVTQLELGLENMSPAGPAVLIDSKNPVPGTLNVTIPVNQDLADGQQLALQTSQLVLIYRGIPNGDEVVIGYTTEFQRSEGGDTLNLDIDFYGTFQVAAITATQLEPKKEVTTINPALTSGGQFAENSQWDQMNADVANNGQGHFSGTLEGLDGDLSYCTVLVDRDKKPPYDHRSITKSPDFYFQPQVDGEYVATFICSNQAKVTSTPSPWTPFVALTKKAKQPKEEVSETEEEEKEEKVGPPAVDTAKPTVANGIIASANLADTNMDLSWAAATDNTTPAGSLNYTLYQSLSPNIDTLVNTLNNGTAIGSGTNMLQLNASGLTASTTYYFNVVVEDQAGNKRAYSMLTEGTDPDTTNPTPTISADVSTTATNAGTINVTVQWDEDVSGFEESDVTLNNANMVAASLTGSGSSYTFSITPQTEGIIRVNIAGAVANDAASNGNNAATEWNSTYDSIAPTATLTPTETSPSNATFFTVNIGWNEPVTGFGLEDLVVGDGTLSNFIGSGSAYSVRVTPTTENGSVTLNINAAGAVDSAQNGNAAPATLSFVSDATLPTPGAAVAASNITSTTVDLSWGPATDNHTTTSFTYHIYKSETDDINNSHTIAQIESNGDLVSAEFGTAYTVTGLSDSSTYYFNVIVEDEAGNKAPYAHTIASTMAPPPTWTSVGLGAYHSCAIRSDGKAFCWGSGGNGQLGNGADSDSQGPVEVAGNFVDWEYVEGGMNFTCGLRNGGLAYCWGDNSVGQLGDNTTTARNVPAPVSGGLSYKELSVGYFTACGIRTSDDKLECWGKNTEDQFGINSQTNSSIPLESASGDTFATVSVGYKHACGTTIAGDTQCWGYGDNGRLANGSLADESVPSTINGGQVFTSLSLGTNNHSCGFESDGTGYCWGKNDTGRIGNNGGAGVEYLSPVLIDTSWMVGSTTFTQMSSSGSHNCAISGDGKPYCWGYDNSGELGDSGGNLVKKYPVPVDTSTILGAITFSDIAVGNNHSCGLATDNELFCWGRDDEGQIGDGGSAVSRSFPRKVPAPAL